MKKELLANTRIANLAETQRQFGAYREFYNKGRPHHALNLDTPIQKYTPSERLYPEKISQWEYPEDCKIRRVRGNGFFTCEGQGCFLSEIFDGMIHRNCTCHS